MYESLKIALSCSFSNHKGLCKVNIKHIVIIGVPGYLVAVKMAKEESSKDQVDEMKMESAIMAQFKHPNVVGLIGQVSTCI